MITSLAIGERYIPYAERLKESLPEGETLYEWRVFPPNSPPHKDLHYAFKYYCVSAVAANTQEVMYLDAACYVVGDTKTVWEETRKRGVYIIAGDDRLGEWISDKALAYFGVTRQQVFDENILLCGGCIVSLDLTNPKAQIFLKRWKELAKTDLFMASHSRYAPDRMTSLLYLDGSQKPDGTGGELVSRDPRVKGHRSDEACFSLLLRELDIKPVNVHEWNKTFQSGYTL